MVVPTLASLCLKVMLDPSVAETIVGSKAHLAPDCVF
jgi:hypothetical protein